MTDHDRVPPGEPHEAGRPSLDLAGGSGTLAAPGALGGWDADDGETSPGTGNQHTFDGVEPATDTAQHYHGMDSPA